MSNFILHAEPATFPTVDNNETQDYVAIGLGETDEGKTLVHLEIFDGDTTVALLLHPRRAGEIADVLAAIAKDGAQ